MTGMGVSGRAGPGWEAGCGMDVAQASQTEAGTNPAPSPVLGKFPHQKSTLSEGWQYSINKFDRKRESKQSRLALAGLWKSDGHGSTVGREAPESEIPNAMKLPKTQSQKEASQPGLLPAQSTLPGGVTGAGPGPPAGGLLPRAFRAPAWDTVCMTTGPGGRR